MMSTSRVLADWQLSPIIEREPRDEQLDRKLLLPLGCTLIFLSFGFGIILGTSLCCEAPRRFLAPYPGKTQVYNKKKKKLTKWLSPSLIMIVTDRHRGFQVGRDETVTGSPDLYMCLCKKAVLVQLTGL